MHNPREVSDFCKAYSACEVEAARVGEVISVSPHLVMLIAMSRCKEVLSTGEILVELRAIETLKEV